MPELIATTHRGDASIIDRLEDDWRAFASEPPNSWAMYTPTWLRSWYGAFGRNRPLVIVTVSEGDDLVAVAPFLQDRVGPVTVWRCPANDFSGKADIAVRPPDRDRILEVLWHEIERQHWTAIDWRYAPDSGTMATLVALCASRGLPTTSRHTHRSPFVPLGPGVDPERLGEAKHMRRFRRQLAERGTLTEVLTNPATMANLDTFFRLEAAGWKGRLGTDAGKDPASAAFHSALIAARDHPDFVIVSHEIKLDDTTIAIAIGARSGDRQFSLKTSYDEEWRKYGPGQLAIAFIVRDCHATGYTTYDLLGTDEPYKLRWTDTVESLSHHFIFRASPLGVALKFAIVRSVPIVKRLRTSDLRGAPRRLAGTIRTTLQARRRKPADHE